MAIMYLSEIFFTCSKGQIMHKQLSPYCADAIKKVKSDINSIENSMHASFKLLIRFEDQN